MLANNHTVREIHAFVCQHLHDPRFSVNEIYTRNIIKSWVQNNMLIKVPRIYPLVYSPGPEMADLIRV